MGHEDLRALLIDGRDRHQRHIRMGIVQRLDGGGDHHAIETARDEELRVVQLGSASLDRHVQTVLAENARGFDVLFIASGIHGGETIGPDGLKPAAVADLLRQEGLSARWAIADLVW